jgi:hypothetical protein
VTIIEEAPFELEVPITQEMGDAVADEEMTEYHFHLTWYHRLS